MLWYSKVEVPGRFLPVSERTTICWVQAAALLPIPCAMSKTNIWNDLKQNASLSAESVSQWHAILCNIGCSLAGICVHNLTRIVYTHVHTIPILTHHPTLVNNFPNISLWDWRLQMEVLRRSGKSLQLQFPTVCASAEKWKNLKKSWSWLGSWESYCI